jgi:two-component system, NtrC family, nitrogen regulation response regulator NtrX
MSSTPRVIYCGIEDSLFKKLSRYATDFVLEARKINFRVPPQKVAQSRKASVLILKLKNEIDIRAQEWLSRSNASVPVIVLMQNGTVETAIHSLQYGIFDYFCASQDVEAIAKKIREAIAWKNTKAVKRPMTSDYQLLLGKNPDILRVNEQAQRLATDSRPVMFLGEPGTGKEFLANGIHRISMRKSEPFIRYDCRVLKQLTQYGNLSLPELIRMRLQSSASKSEAAVLFLAHMEQLPSDQQLEILDRFNKSKIRLMASFQESRAPFFTEEADSNHSTLKIPPLRQRKEDIPLLAEYFVKQITQQRGIRTKGFTEEVLMLLQEYAWPGNIQELANLIERMIILEPSHLITAATWRICQGYGTRMNLDATNQFAKLLEEVLKSQEGEWKEGEVYNSFIERMEKLLIDLVLPKVDNNQAIAANILGISRNTLRSRRRKAG